MDDWSFTPIYTPTPITPVYTPPPPIYTPPPIIYTPKQTSNFGGGGGGGGGLFGFIDNAAKSVGDTVSNAVNNVNKTVDAIIKNPLPVIETIALTYALGPAGAGLSTAASASVSAAAVTAANGGDVNKIATAAAAGYVGGSTAESVGSSRSEERRVGKECRL